MGKLEVFKDVDFFSWYLYSKMKDNTISPFKLIKASDSLSIPVIVSDKS